jgi:hypothetical protein
VHCLTGNSCCTRCLGSRLQCSRLLGSPFGKPQGLHAATRSPSHPPTIFRTPPGLQRQLQAVWTVSYHQPTPAPQDPNAKDLDARVWIASDASSSRKILLRYPTGFWSRLVSCLIASVTHKNHLLTLRIAKFRSAELSVMHADGPFRVSQSFKVLWQCKAASSFLLDCIRFWIATNSNLSAPGMVPSIVGVARAVSN